MSNKEDPNKHSPGKLYEFTPNEDIKAENVIELCKVIRIGVGSHVLKEMSEELQAYFKEVA